MANNNTEKPKEQIILEYYEEDLCKVWSYQRFIKKHIKLKNKIPARVLKQYFDLFDKTVYDSIQFKQKIVNNAREITLKLIIEHRQTFAFDANIKNKRRKNIKINVPPDAVIPEPIIMLDKSLYPTHFSSTIFINNYFDRLLKEKHFEEITGDRYKLMIDIIKQLLYYIRSCVSPPQKNFPSDYKLTIIVGLILVSFGHLNDKETWENSGSKYKLYNAYLNKYVEYHFNNVASPLRKK